MFVCWFAYTGAKHNLNAILATEYPRHKTWGDSPISLILGRKEDNVTPEERDKKVLGPFRSSDAPSSPFPQASGHPNECPWLQLPLPSQAEGSGGGGGGGSPSLPAPSVAPVIAARFLWRPVPHPAATLRSPGPRHRLFHLFAPVIAFLRLLHI